MTVTLIPSWQQDEHIGVIKALVTRPGETDMCFYVSQGGGFGIRKKTIPKTKFLSPSVNMCSSTIMSSLPHLARVLPPCCESSSMHHHSDELSNLCKKSSVAVPHEED